MSSRGVSSHPRTVQLEPEQGPPGSRGLARGAGAFPCVSSPSWPHGAAPVGPEAQNPDVQPARASVRRARGVRTPGAGSSGRSRTVQQGIYFSLTPCPGGFPQERARSPRGRQPPESGDGGSFLQASAPASGRTGIPRPPPNGRLRLRRTASRRPAEESARRCRWVEASGR